MEVRALSDGFYGGARRRAGKTFQVGEGETSNWFEPTAPEQAGKPKGKPLTKAEAKAKAEAEAKAKAEAEAKAKAEAEGGDGGDGAGDLV